VIEFECVDCGIYVYAVCVDKVPEPPLCAMCLFLPNWFEDPRLARIYGYQPKSEG
jgi:hypothetical protein